MLKLYFMTITCLIFLISHILSEPTFCDQIPFTDLCNSFINLQFQSKAQGALQNSSDTQVQTSLKDYLTLYKDFVNLLKLTKRDINPTTIKKRLVATEHRPSGRDLGTTYADGLVRLAEGEGTLQVNLVVAQDGTGNFTTISEALEAAENYRRSEADRLVIYVKKGIYKEKIVINRSLTNLKMVGDGIDATVITNDKSIYDGLSTSDTATVEVWGTGFVAVGITFENTAGPEKRQAIALLSVSDFSVFYKCSFKGYQDTLCLLQFRHFIRECDIYGTIDFIFGDATAILQNCTIYVRTPLPRQQNIITAQGRNDSSSNTGFVIHISRVIPAPDAGTSVVTFLGRPWRDYSRVVYVKCDLDVEIDPAGWLPYRGDSAFDRVYYAEYLNTGKGSGTGGRVTWPGYHVLRSEEEVQGFSVGFFLSGESWIPETGVAFSDDI